MTRTGKNCKQSLVAQKFHPASIFLLFSPQQLQIIICSPAAQANTVITSCYPLNLSTSLSTPLSITIIKMQLAAVFAIAATMAASIAKALDLLYMTYLLAILAFTLFCLFLLLPPTIATPIKRAALILGWLSRVLARLFVEIFRIPLAAAEDKLIALAKKKQAEEAAQAEEERRREFDELHGLTAPKAPTTPRRDQITVDSHQKDDEYQPIAPVPNPHAPRRRTRPHLEFTKNYKRGQPCQVAPPTQTRAPVTRPPQNLYRYDHDAYRMRAPLLARPSRPSERKGIDPWRAERLAADQFGFIGLCS